MKILPPENLRNPSDNDGPPGNDLNQHYHYHAAGDAEDRVRRDAVRDYLYDDLIRRDAKRRRRWKAIGMIAAGAIILVVLATPFRNDPSVYGDTAVQVRSEYRDGKWVATAQRVPAPVPSPTVTPLENYAGYGTNAEEADEEQYAEGSGESSEPDFITRYRAERNGTTGSIIAAALRRCQGHFISPDGVMILVKDRSVTTWKQTDIAQGDATGKNGYGEPTETGMRFVKANGDVAARLRCETDHLLLTAADGTSALIPRASADEAEETLVAWMLER